MKAEKGRLGMRQACKRLILPHILLAVLLFAVICLPNSRSTTRPCGSFLAAIAVMEALFLFAVFRRRPSRECACARVGHGPFDIICLVWVLLLAWELATSVCNAAHPVLVPAPENVFDTFREQWDRMLLNVAYSLQLLLLGLVIGLAAAVALGMVAGWVPRIRAFAYPIANVMAPIPPIVFSPYLVALMPTFRSASLLVIVLGVFWPTFLNTVNRVASMERRILDSARMLNPSVGTMIRSILLPYLIPGVVSGLKVTLTTSMLMLNFAELMGATHGMGFYVQNSITYANYTHAVAGILVIGIVVTVLSALVGWLQKRCIKWR